MVKPKTNVNDTNEQINETTQNDSITVEYKPSDLIGSIITLTDGPAYWATNSGNIKLSRFTGNLSYKITKETTIEDLNDILRAIVFGNVKITDTMVTEKPLEIYNIDPVMLSRINFILDEKNIEKFQAKINSITSRAFLTECLHVEKKNRNRPEYVTIISEKLNI
jgi:hypothetical protein